MSKALDALNAIGIHNPHNAASKAHRAGIGRGLFIVYSPTEHGRCGQSAHWRVTSTAFKVNHESHWRDYGSKRFLCGTGEKLDKEAEAKRWASKKFKVKEWAKIPGLRGCWFPKATAEFIKSKLAAKPTE